MKYCMYANKLQTKFYFDLLNFFCNANENIIGICCGAKFMLAAKVFFKVSLKYHNINKSFFTQNMKFFGM